MSQNMSVRYGRFRYVYTTMKRWLMVIFSETQTTIYEGRLRMISLYISPSLIVSHQPSAISFGHELSNIAITKDKRMFFAVIIFIYMYMYIHTYIHNYNMYAHIVFVCMHEWMHCMYVEFKFLANGCVVKWAECSLIIGTGCRVEVFSLILDSSVGLSMGIQSAGDLVSETLMGSNPALSKGRQLVSFRFEYHLPVPEHRN